MLECNLVDGLLFFFAFLVRLNLIQKSTCTGTRLLLSEWIKRTVRHANVEQSHVLMMLKHRIILKLAQSFASGSE